MDYLVHRIHYLTRIEKCFYRCYQQTFKRQFETFPEEHFERSAMLIRMDAASHFSAKLREITGRPAINPLSYAEDVLAELKNGSKPYQDDDFYRRRFERRMLKASQSSTPQQSQ